MTRNEIYQHLFDDGPRLRLNIYGRAERCNPIEGIHAPTCSYMVLPILEVKFCHCGLPLMGTVSKRSTPTSSNK